jgi:predicted nucleotidyltransferase
LSPAAPLFDLGGLLMDLRDLLGIKVDVISENGIRDRWRDI